MKRKIYVNIIINLLLQFVTVISGFILPRLFLSTFGSEVNGLVSSLTQFLNYVSLLEGGVTSVMMASLYKPLYNNDNEKISSVVAASNQFFKKISYVFLGYTLILAVVYPFLIKSNFSWSYIFVLTLILGINLFIQYNFSLSMKLLLNADNKIYITSSIQIIVIILNTIAVYFGIKIFPNIHIIKLITALVYLLQPIGYYYFVNKYYDLDKKAVPDKKAISQRWNGFGINIAYFIHNNTDLVLISYFINLSSVSVYSTYMLVINGIKAIEGAISSALTPTIGRLIAKNDRNEITDAFEVFEFFLIFLVFFFFTVTSVLIVPFVMIYTRGIHDANYFQPFFAIIMILAEFMYCIRDPYVIVAYQAGHFKQLEKCAITEAILNIIISIILIPFCGIIGVAIGTFVAMTYRTIYQVFYLQKHILKRSVKYFFKYMIIFGISSIVIYLSLNGILNLEIYTILSWLKNAFITVIITFLVFLLISYVFFKKTLYNFINYILLKK